MINIHQTAAQRAAAKERAATLAAIDQVEAAVDAHAVLRRPKAGLGYNDTRIVSSRDWVEIEMSVRVADGRFKPRRIHAGADTLDEAITKFIHDLDTWTEVF